MKVRNVVRYILMIYVVCYLFRLLEYFVIRTDQSIIGEAFMHKIIGIVIMFAMMKKCQLSLTDIGITKNGCVRYTLYGLVFGLVMFAVGYAFEIILLSAQDKLKSVKVYVSSYAVDRNIVMESGMIFFIICIIGNIINVMMEEGIFRGLFQKLLMQKYTFVKTAIFCSMLFGLWHIIGPIRNYVDGISSLNGTIANVFMLLITSGLIAFKYAMLARLEGALYMGMADHFVNNTIVNILHVNSVTGTDELMFARISIAQSMSFIIVLFVFLKKEKINKTVNIMTK